MTASDLVIVGVAFAAGCFFLYILVRTVESRFLHLPQVKRARQVERLQQEVDALQKLVREAPRETQAVPAPPVLEASPHKQPLYDTTIEVEVIVPDSALDPSVKSIDRLRQDAAKRPYPEQF